MGFESVYYSTQSGRKPVEEFILEQDEKTRGKIARSIMMLEEQGYLLTRPAAAKVRDKIYELRIEFSPNNYRIFYYFTTGSYVVMLHAVKKKTDKLKVKDIETAVSRMMDFELRIKKGEIKL